MQYRLVVLLNTGPRAMLEWRRGDALDVIERPFHCSGDTIEAALEALWAVGNKMERDDFGLAYPTDRRSMCTGDLVAAVEVGSEEFMGLWACDSFGWTPLEKYVDARERITAEIERKFAEIEAERRADFDLDPDEPTPEPWSGTCAECGHSEDRHDCCPLRCSDCDGSAVFHGYIDTVEVAKRWKEVSA